MLQIGWDPKSIPNSHVQDSTCWHTFDTLCILLSSLIKSYKQHYVSLFFFFFLCLVCPAAYGRHTHRQILSNWPSPYLRPSVGFANGISQYLTKYSSLWSQRQRVHSLPSHIYYGTYVPCSQYTHPEYCAFSLWHPASVHLLASTLRVLVSRSSKRGSTPFKQEPVTPLMGSRTPTWQDIVPMPTK